MAANEHVTTNGPLHEEHEVFERCLRDVLAGRASVRDCVQRYPHLPELGALLATALRAHRLPQPSMPSTARDELRAEILGRHRLLYEKPESVSAEETGPFSLGQVLHMLRLLVRPALAFAIVVALFFGGGVMLIQAARETVPGDALYGLKRAVEYAELSLAEPTARSAILVRFAQVRLDEMDTLRQRGQAIPESAVLDAAEQINAALLQAPSVEIQRTLYLAAVAGLQRAIDAGQLELDAAESAVESLSVPAEMRHMATLSVPAGGQANRPPTDPPGRTVTTVVASHTPHPTRTLRPTDELDPTRTPRSTDEPDPTRPPRPTRTERPTDMPEPTRTPRPDRNTGNSQNSGNSGNNGNQGNPNQGNQGGPANTGNQGNQDNQGNQGNQGSQGNPGNVANPGDGGNPGNSGNSGNQGDPGNAGDPGNPGQDKEKDKE